MERCTLEKEGFIANYYSGNYETDKAIISVGGASCDEKTSIAMAEYLIKEGYNVLVLGFYLWKGLSKNLASIPVDYAEKAVHWLLDKKKVKRIAMTGASTGGAFTLLSASLIPEITCIIPIVPYDHVLEGTTQNMKRLHCSIYTWHGEDIPYTPTELLDIGMMEWLRRAKKAQGYGLARFMRYGYDQITSILTPKSRIKSENMNADVLLFAVKNDDCWPSDEAVSRIVDNFKKVNYAHRIEYHIYEKGSHALTTGKLGFIPRTLSKLMIPAEKKYPKECDEAREDSVQRILKFLKEW